MNDAASIAATLTGDAVLDSSLVVLDPGGLRIAVRSNSKLLLQRIDNYFAHVRTTSPADIDVTLIDGPVVDCGLPFIDWKRDPEKSGLKEACHDLSDGRLIRKVRTGMLFLQSELNRIARGPCLTYDSQVINFINNQYMNWLQQKGARICHAAGVSARGRSLGMAGVSGRGKSTLMLHLLEQPDCHFLTNDRLFLTARADSTLHAHGIPKLPRINPGTIVSIPRLHSIPDSSQLEAFRKLPPDELWDLEHKFDVDVGSLYGEARIVTDAPLVAFVILNWDRNSDQPCGFRQIDLNKRRELLGGVMKSPGPFCQFSKGQFCNDDFAPSPDLYVETLKDIPVWEVTGRVDFDSAAGHCRNILKEQTC